MNIVKLMIVTTCTVMVIGACATAGKCKNAPGGKAPEALVIKVGEEVAQLLFDAEHVSFYILDNSAEDADAEPFPGYFRHGEGRELTCDQVAVLRFLLPGNHDNYIPQDGPILMAPFLPFREFVFIKGEQRISLLVSTSDLSWALVRDGQLLDRFPYMERKTVERLMEVFH